MIFDYNPITGLIYTSPVHIPIAELPSVTTANFISRWKKIQESVRIQIVEWDSGQEEIDNSFFSPVIKTNALEPK
tara:strand:+ start:4153 stop:4377 length:225 start_codon:yes stop_codon:yes gene_type:complete